MANFDMASHQLRFTTGDNAYKYIEVVDDTENVVATFNLQTSNQSISILVEDDDYVVNNAENFTTATNKLDIGNGSTLEFNYQSDPARMGGIGIVDLRDMQPGGPITATYDYDLQCTTFRLKYVAGAFALRINFENTGCIDWEEQ